tara:strand:- start:140 stop:1570 length:1431 start_codon:yes stop_codon:yes gene_type:complete
MGISYFQGKKGLDHLAKEVPAFKGAMAILNKTDRRKNLYLEFKDGKLPSKPRIKINPKDTQYAELLVGQLTTKSKGSIKLDKSTSPGDTYVLSVGSNIFKLYLSGRTLSNVIDENGKAVDAKSPKTAQQEDGAMISLNEGKFLKHKQINDKIGFEFNDDWYKSFKLSYNIFTDKVIPEKSLGDYIFYRDSNKKKPDFLNKITDEAILPTKKDNWNPADVWAVKKEAFIDLAKEVDALYEKLKDKNVSIEKLNKFVENKFKDKSLIGISLKQVKGSKANLDTIKNDAKFFKAIIYKGVANKFKFKADNSYVDFIGKFSCFKSTNIEYRFRFRSRAASGQLDMYGEGQPVTQKTFDGAIDKQFTVNKFLKDGPNFTNFIKTFKAKKAKSVIDGLNLLPKTYSSFVKYVKKNKFDFLDVDMKSMEMNLKDEYKVRRAIYNLYYAYMIETFRDRKEMMKQFYLSAKKMSEFSSIHYKIYG